MEPFIGQILLFAGYYAPRGFATCDGQPLSISPNSALFSILGTTHGGDGRTSLGLPDLRGRAPVHVGQGPGLTTRRLGEKVGAETVNLEVKHRSRHSHAVQPRGTSMRFTSTQKTSMSAEMLQDTGEGESFGNVPAVAGAQRLHRARQDLSVPELVPCK